LYDNVPMLVKNDECEIGGISDRLEFISQ